MKRISRGLLRPEFLLALVFLCLPPTLAAQAPPNDDCENAVEVFLGITEGSTVTATTDVDQPCGDYSLDVHYFFEAPEDFILAVDTCRSVDPNVDTVITVWEGTECPPAEPLGCQDDACGPGSGFASQVEVPVEGGSQYLITVSGWGGNGYEFSLRLQQSTIGIPEPCDYSSEPGVGFMTESFDNSVILLGNTVSCHLAPPSVNADNGYYRQFDLALNGVADAIEIVAIEVGIEGSYIGPGLDTQPVNLKVYRDTTPGHPAPLAELELLGEQHYALPEFIGPGLHCFPFDTPIAISPDDIEIVVEFDIPSAFQTGLNYLLFIGSNDLGEETPTYLRSEDCGIPEPLTNDEIGFPNMHMVLTVFFQSPDILRGDADGNGVVNPLSDAIYILEHQFGSGPAPPCLEAADIDDDSTFNGLTDGSALLAYGFLGGPPPGAPFPVCGMDPDPDNALSCVSAVGCM